MRPEGNSLDLNNLPEEHGKQPLEESSMTTAASADTTRFKKKKGAGKDDSAKVYECRFCSLKFCKSQALGGHMNRHRQERETETLNRARQLVFSNEGLAGSAAIGLRDLNLGGSQIPPGPGGFHHGHGGGGFGDPCLQLRPVYPRIPPTHSQPPNPSHLQQYMYPSSSSHSLPYSPSYQPPPPHPPVGNYYIGHVVPAGTSSPSQPHHTHYGPDSSFTCLGAPLSRSLIPIEGGDGPPRNQTDEKNWPGCTTYGHVAHMDSSSSVDRFGRDNFHS